MKLPWLIKKTPAHAEPVPTSVAEQAPEPEPTQERAVAPAAAVTEPGGIDFTRVIASIVTAASAVFTVWSVWDLARHGAEEGQAAPHVVGLGAGTGVEAVWLWLLAIEWQQATRTGRVNPLLTRTGWVLAAGAAVVLVVHGVMTSWPMVLLAVLPLAAKAGWHWLTALRCEQTLARMEAEAAAAREAAEAQRQAEQAARAEADRVRERELALSTDLTETEERELAGLRRKAVYARAKAKAENELTTAEADADRLRQEAAAEAERIRQETEHRMRQEAIRRRVEEQMAVQQANADLLKQRQALELELQLTSPYAIGGGSGSQSRVPDDLSDLDTEPPTGGAVAGFGFPQAGVPTRSAHPADQQVPEVRTQVHPSQIEAKRNRQAVLAAYDRLVQAGLTPSISAVAAEARVSRRTVTRHLPEDKKPTQS